MDKQSPDLSFKFQVPPRLEYLLSKKDRTPEEETELKELVDADYEKVTAETAQFLGISAEQHRADLENLFEEIKKDSAEVEHD